ncbi:hypothetical protein, partial [Xanthomonas citri]|uniref:hypothetical protein n=1 Tax=Xanthomonas citri TaxID=346 RepID=UPI00103FFF3C
MSHPGAEFQRDATGTLPIAAYQAAEIPLASIDCCHPTNCRSSMRGVDVFSEQLFTVKRLDDFIPGTH